MVQGRISDEFNEVDCKIVGLIVKGSWNLEMQFEI